MGETSAADRAMARYGAGDDDAFGELYDAIAPKLHRHLSRHARSAADADDLLQQTFLQLHRARGTFFPGARVLPWAFRIARCLLIDGIRKQRREAAIMTAPGETTREALSTEASAYELVHGGQLAARAVQVLAGLPESQRIAFELVRLDGLSLADAAAFLETTPTAVKLRVFRASEALRAELGETDEAARNEA